MNKIFLREKDHAIKYMKMIIASVKLYLMLLTKTLITKTKSSLTKLLLKVIYFKISIKKS